MADRALADLRCRRRRRRRSAAAVAAIAICLRRRLGGGADEIAAPLTADATETASRAAVNIRRERPNQEPVRRVAEINLIVMHASPSGAEPPGQTPANPASEKLDRDEPGRGQRAEGSRHATQLSAKWVEIGSCALPRPSRRGSRQDATDDLLRWLDHSVLFDEAILDLANEFVAVLYKLRSVRLSGQRLLGKGRRVKPQFADPVPGQVLRRPSVHYPEAKAAQTR